MAATKAQGRAFTLFMGGLTAATAGIAFFSSGSGKAALVLGAAVVAFSLFRFLKIKPDEGKVALGAQPAVQKLIGVVLALGGLGSRSIRIAFDGKCFRKNDHYAHRLRSDARRSSLRSSVSGKQKRYLEGLAA